MPFVRIPTLIPARLIADYGDGKSRWTEYVEAHARQVVANGNAQIAAGLSVPVCWMHDRDARPAYLSHRPRNESGPKDSNPHEWMAKGFIGYVRRWEYDPAAANGKGAAVAVAEIFDRADADQFVRVGRVSPCLQPGWRDERGRVWPGFSVQHIASTPKPKIRDLPPVAPLPEYRTAWADAGGGAAAYLSFPAAIRSHAVTHDTDDDKPGKPAAAPFAPGGDAPAAPPAELSDDPGGPSGSSAEPQPEPKRMDADAHCLSRLAELFARLGVHVAGSPKTLDELLIAAESGVATQNGGPLDAPVDPMEGTAGPRDDGDMTGDDDAHMPAGTPAVWMSWSPSQIRGCERIAAGYARDYEADIRRLMADDRVDQRTGGDLLAMLTEANLSHEPHARLFDEDFAFREPPVAGLIAAYKKLPKGKFAAQRVAEAAAAAANLSHTPPNAPHAPVAPPAMGDAAVTPEEMRAEAARRAAGVGIPLAAAARPK